MKRILLLVLLLVSCASPALCEVENAVYFDMPIKTLYVMPTTESEVKLDIPVEVRIIGVNEERTWFKVKIAYDLMFMGRYEYIGWVHAPLDEYLRAKPAPK